MKKYVGNMKKYVENVKKSVEKIKNYVENMKKALAFRFRICRLFEGCGDLPP